LSNVAASIAGTFSDPIFLTLKLQVTLLRATAAPAGTAESAY